MYVLQTINCVLVCCIGLVDPGNLTQLVLDIWLVIMCMVQLLYVTRTKVNLTNTIRTTLCSGNTKQDGNLSVLIIKLSALGVVLYLPSKSSRFILSITPLLYTRQRNQLSSLRSPTKSNGVQPNLHNQNHKCNITCNLYMPVYFSFIYT